MLPPNNLNIKYIFDKEKIIKEATKMREDKQKNENLDKEEYKKKYSYLSKNFPDLFDMVYEDPDNHDCLEMLKTIIRLADMYHKDKISFEDSSKNAGQILFNKFYTEKKNEKEGK